MCPAKFSAQSKWSLTEGRALPNLPAQIFEVIRNQARAKEKGTACIGDGGREGLGTGQWIAVLGVGCRLEGRVVACDLWLQEVADDGVQSYVRAVQEIKQGKLVERPVCTIKRCPAVAPAAPLASRIAFHQIDADQGIN